MIYGCCVIGSQKGTLENNLIYTYVIPTYYFDDITVSKILCQARGAEQ
jgi:hypothetical protein